MLTITRGHLSHLSDICSQLQVSRFPHQGSAHTAGDLRQLSIFREYTRTNFKFTFVLVVVLVLEFKPFCYFSFDHWHDMSCNGIYIRFEELFNLSNPPNFFQQIFACQALLIHKTGFMSGEYYCSVKGPVIIYCPGGGGGGLGAKQGDIVIVRSHGLLCHFYADDAQL